ncbi:PAS domain-containing protein [Brevundimonas sp. 2R-24]|uniref:histidine kinase n=1 Tax=Peiella sedimenti TaxID=3061083 RepID=A0ABT8SPE2_9CAUL|nr:PAS domain-containing protein [Caulobacteraceae bacterium XZ-24]
MAESARLASLRHYQVLDTEPEAALDDLTKLAARLCSAPRALVSLVDEDRQWFKARVGVEARETPREISFCRHAILSDETMVVPDAAKDPRFADNPLVTGDFGLRFYAGAPLVTPEGQRLGTLCVIDTQPRPTGLTPQQASDLELLARQVMDHLQLRRMALDREADARRLESALAASQVVGAWDWDVRGDKVITDARFARMFGVDPEEGARGLPLATFVNAIHPEDRDRVARIINESLRAGGGYEAEYRVISPYGERWVLARGEVLIGEDGKPLRFPGVVVDITERKQMEAELEETARSLIDSEARFRALADAMPQMVWSTTPDGLHDYFNARWYQFTGMAEGSTDGEGWAEMFHPDDQERAWSRWRRSLETGDPYEVEYRLRHHSGEFRWTLGRALPLRDGDGRIRRWFGTCTDIHDLKQGEEQRELLSHELSHRIKNIFAVMSALISLSAREHPEGKAFAGSLKRRIGALARAHEFVRPHSRVSSKMQPGPTLRPFLMSLFEPYRRGEGEPACVRLEGDDVEFDDQVATPLALLFHELATNAAKYGALSTPDGCVGITIRRDGEELHITWKETGGPPVAGEPSREGFGSTLARHSVVAQLRGDLERVWETDGLKVLVTLPVAAMSRPRRAASSLGTQARLSR